MFADDGAEVAGNGTSAFSTLVVVEETRITAPLLQYSALSTCAFLWETCFKETKILISYLTQQLDKVLSKAVISYPTKPVSW